MVKIATVCMGSDPRDKAANRNKMIAYIEKAAAQEADLIVFPEEILTGVGTVGMQQFKGEDKLFMQQASELVPEGEDVYKRQVLRLHGMRGSLQIEQQPAQQHVVEPRADRRR